MAQQEKTVNAKEVSKKPSLTLELNAGYSMALGQYSQWDRDNGRSGYAASGWLAQFTVDWMGKKSFGVALQYTFQRNPLRDTASNVVPYGMTYPLGTGAWTNHYLMIGPVYLKDFHHLHVDAKFLFGAMISSSAVFNVTDPVTLQNVKDVGMGLALQLSAGAGYTFSSHFALKFNLGYLAGWPVKKKIYGQQILRYDEIIDPKSGMVIGYVPVYSAAVTYEIRKVISTLNPSAGLVYRF